MRTFKRIITISVTTQEEACKIRDNIHKQLVGNQHYINNDIVLSDALPKTIRVFITSNVENIPKITI